MKIAIYGREFPKENSSFIFELFEILKQHKTEIYIHESFLEFLNKTIHCKPEVSKTFTAFKNLDSKIDFFISIGGDGTFLESVDIVRDLQIPIIGINSGRLGFLANIAKENTITAIQTVLDGKCEIEERSLLALETENNLFGEFNTALNEVTISRKDTSSMITIKTYVNGEFLNAYWTDGLIISTPTGSTGYSLSVGGPIVMPGTKNFIISPIAPHNLTVRPMVIPDDKVITLKVEGRAEQFLATLDFRTKVFEKDLIITIKKADYTIKTIKLPDISFFSTIRNKLLWGLDRRN
ncbi:MAG: NAD kinase [Bacteroidales bacterium]|nr:NAD kinase [Bacteroidales bacterium]